jgi:hypothetical protein
MLIDLGPFTNEVTQILRIKNPNQLPVAFKVRKACYSARFSMDNADDVFHG